MTAAFPLTVIHMTTLHQTLPAIAQRSYPIIIEPHALDRLTEILGNIGMYPQYVILYDARLQDLAHRVQQTLPQATMLTVPSGEHSKSLAMVESIIQQMLDRQILRSALLINIGGGMLTDLGGFIGSIYLRGIDFVHISTSVLGMVDAAIGGKTGIDFASTKNSIGTIAHPRAIIVDTTVLSSLPDQQLKEGLVEVIKMAAILDEGTFTWLERHIEPLLERSPSELQTCIERAASMKTTIVAADEREMQQRMLLNFGHTVGHALEICSQFTISHGIAVSMGMVAEMALAQSPAAARVTDLLRKIDMPVNLPTGYAAESLWNIMLRDKKNTAGLVRMAIPCRIGAGEIRSLSKDQFLHLLQ